MMTEMIDHKLPILSTEDIVFEFETFLEEHEENLPDGLDAEYMTYVPILESPIKRFTELPKALSRLPINAILHQSWLTLYGILGLIMLFSLPTFGYLIYVASIVGRTATGVAFTVIILLGIFAGFSYMKYIYETLSNLMDSRKAPWLVEKIRKQFISNYQEKWDKRLLSVTFLLTFIIDGSLIFVGLAELNFQINLLWVLISALLLIVGHTSITIMIYISIQSYRFIRVNTKIYDQVLQTIIDRVEGYTKGQESILNKKNYEVVGVLSDTPGLSIRSLGDIPVFGLGTGIFSVNALIFLLISPLLFWSPGTSFIINLGGGDESTGLSRVILIGIALSSIASFGAIIGPLWRITRVMGNYKYKALSELDPYLFDEITGVALRKDTEISNDTQVLFMIRSYIYSMKTSPVNPFRLVYIVTIALVYGLRGLPFFIDLLSRLGGGGA